MGLAQKTAWNWRAGRRLCSTYQLGGHLWKGTEGWLSWEHCRKGSANRLDANATFANSGLVYPSALLQVSLKFTYALPTLPVLLTFAQGARRNLINIGRNGQLVLKSSLRIMLISNLYTLV